jgi:phosphoribosylcarboxyaminoimidazole (NCAIR) mutase
MLANQDKNLNERLQAFRQAQSAKVLTMQLPEL